jgi:hypothetical protein
VEGRTDGGQWEEDDGGVSWSDTVVGREIEITVKGEGEIKRKKKNTL